MDIGSVSTDLALTSTGQGVAVGVLQALQNLDHSLGAQLAASIGLGANVDAFA